MRFNNFMSIEKENNRMVKKFTFQLLIFVLLPVCSCINSSNAKLVVREEKAEKIKWFTDARFGMFIHWGPSSVYGKEISWSRGGHPPDSWNKGGTIDSLLYDNSFKIFNPSKYDPKEWVRLAKDAGMKYMVITTRHHDGFSMFNTKYSEFKITNPEGAYRKWIAEQNPRFNAREINQRTDIVRQFAEAVHEAGIGLGFYYSEPDWVREDYRIALTGKDLKGKSVSDPEQKAAEKSYQEFMHDQLNELTTQYGKVDLIWFDAIKPAQVKDLGMKAIWIEERTLEMLRKNQPGILIDDRTGFKPDFITNEVRDTRYIPDLVTESENKLGDPYWSYSPEGTSKSSQWIIDRLIINAGNNSNLLLNIGPSPEGEIPQMYIPVLLETGKWLSSYGKAIYGTHGGPFFNQYWGVSTFRDNKVFLFLEQLNDEDLVLPPLNQSVISAHMYADDKEIEFNQGRDNIRLKLAESIKKTNNRILVLEFNSSLEATR
jgi:alpha-L-fucosidase